MNNKLLKICLVFVLIIATSGCGETKKESFRAEGTTGVETASSSPASDNRLYVYVCGEVVTPGVYELPTGSRIKDAIESAGGLTDAADDTAVNLAAILKDQEKIVIPLKGAAGDAKATGSGLLNINTATKDQLMKLPGIGEAKADSIISYRESKGGFKNIDELQKVEGIKSGVYNRIKDSISVN